MRLIRLQAALLEQFEKGVDLVVFEASRNLRYGNAVRVAAQIQGVIELVCTNNKVEYKGFSPKEIKKHACGSGNADKDAMVAAAKKKWPKIKLESNDHADALWLLDFAQAAYGEAIKLSS